MHRAQYLLAYCEADIILGQPRKNPSASHLEANCLGWGWDGGEC